MQRFALPILALLLVLPGTAAPTAAQASEIDSTGVVYLFSQQIMGGERSFALVPMVTNRVRPSDSPRVSIAAAFDLLRSRKPAIYGSTRIEATDADLAEGRVRVVLGPESGQHFSVIAAETVFTFTQLGVERVHFPGVSDAGMTRADIPFASYRLQVPLWQAMPPARLIESDVRVSGTLLMDGAAFLSAWEARDPELVDAIFEALGTSDSYVSARVLDVVLRADLPGWPEAVVTQLPDRERDWRMRALEALGERSGDLAWDAIVERMNDDPESAIRSRAAELLAGAPEERYRIHALVHRVQDGPSAQRVDALEALAGMQLPEAQAQVVRALGSEEESVGMRALRILADREDWVLLISRAEEEGALTDDRRLAVAEVLALEAPEGEALRGQRLRVELEQGESARNAVGTIGRAGLDDARRILEEILEEDAREDVRRAALDALVERAEAASLPAIAASAARAGAPDEGEVADALMRILERQDLGTLRETAAAPDPLLQRATRLAYHEVIRSGRGDARLRSELEEAVASTIPAIRGAAAYALSAYADEAAFSAVFALIDEESELVRADVALGLGSFAEEEWIRQTNPVLVTMVEGAEPTVQANAIRAIGALGMRGLLPVITGRMTSSDVEIRLAAIRAAGDLADPENPRLAINAIGGRLRDDDTRVRVAAALELGRFEHELAVLTISQVLNERVADARFAAIRALGSTGHPAAIGPLVTLIEDGDRDVRFAALDALEALGLHDAVPQIRERVERVDDAATRQRAEEVAQALQAGSGR